jgi:hypothetical protein
MKPFGGRLSHPFGKGGMWITTIKFSSYIVEKYSLLDWQQKFL